MYIEIFEFKPNLTVKSYLFSPHILLYPGCPEGFTLLRTPDGLTTVGCYAVVGPSQPWNTSTQACKALNPAAHLVDLNDAVEDAVVKAYLKTGSIPSAG